MDIRRITLYAALMFVIYSLWTAWEHDYPSKVQTPLAGPNQGILPKDQGLVPSMSSEKKSDTLKTSVQSSAILQGKSIHVKTDVLDLTIDTHGNVVKTNLLAYPVSVNEKNNPFVLLNNKPNKHYYVANSSLLVNEGPVTKELTLAFNAQQTSYFLEPGQATLKVVLEGQDNSGLIVKKIFTFSRADYAVDVRYELTNTGATAWQGYMNTQILRTPPEEKSSFLQVVAYTGASYGNPGHTKYQKVSFKEMAKRNLQVEGVAGGWVAMQEHYFLTAWIPAATDKSLFYTRFMEETFTIGAVSQPITIEPGKSHAMGSKLYLGPEDTEKLAHLAPGLDMTVDYGFFWFISSPLFKLMSLIYSVIGNWGWAIVLVTLLIKLAFYRLSARSYRSMAGMRKLQPKLLALKERYADDKAKLSQATMELYRQEKVNPLGGCLPILLQIPVFIGLYWVLLESVELRQAPFILWLADLSVADPLHVLPLIMGATMLIQQRLNPAPPDPVQAKMMMFLPILFTGLFWSFPAGLVLYWIVNNTLSILQQWYITRKYGQTDNLASKKTALAK